MIDHDISEQQMPANHDMLPGKEKLEEVMEELNNKKNHKKRILKIFDR